MNDVIIYRKILRCGGLSFDFDPRYAHIFNIQESLSSLLQVHRPPHSFHWEQSRDMPIAMADAKGILIEGKVYVHGWWRNGG